MKKFKLRAPFKPSGDQPEAIRQLCEGLKQGRRAQTLLGVTGSGKTFTIANVIEQMQIPTLVLSHNKTLAAQLYSEFKEFFPENAVEYFVSYYDYYQPEAYLPVTDTYIEKDLSINEEIEKLRLSTTTALLSGRKDVIVVSSVSCIYGLGNPENFTSHKITLRQGQLISRNKLLHDLVGSMYSRNDERFYRGNFRVKGDTVDIWPAYADEAYRLIFWGDEIENIESFDPINGFTIEEYEELVLYPSNIFVTGNQSLEGILQEIQKDLDVRVEQLQKEGRTLEAKRLHERVTYDIEMIRELGYCSGIENYSRYFDGRKPGQRPFCLLDYFPEDYLIVIDESHVTIPQLRAMYGGDRSRKQNLVEYGFRLPAAMDNRPLTFDEFYALIPQVIYVSATPGDFELKDSEGILVEQVVRPTGLVDPPIEVRPTENQIDDLLEEIRQCVKNDQRVLVTTLTKRMAEELTSFLQKMGVRSEYIHSDIDTLDRVKILEDFRKGMFDVLVGINLLREGLDLPEVALVAILDADKEGFLRSDTSLTQTAGRAARNIDGKVIMYADKITDSMQRTIDETNRRRLKQMEYNRKHGITPKQIVKKRSSAFSNDEPSKESVQYSDDVLKGLVADPVIKYLSVDKLEKLMWQTKEAMEKAAKETNFLEAARLRDELLAISRLIKEKSGN